MLLFAYDYQGDKLEFTVNEEFDYLRVSIVSGDEIVEVWRNGSPGEIPKCIAIVDAGHGRIQDYHDGEYLVARNEVDNWLKRTRSYDW